MTKPRGTIGMDPQTEAIDSVVADPAFFAGYSRPTPAGAAPADPDRGRLLRVADPPDDPAAESPRIKTSVPAQVWATALAGRRRYHELAAIFRPDSYHARTDTAHEKRRLATEILLEAGPAAVDALIDMLVERNVANADIAELLIEIDDPAAAPQLRQLYETGKFPREPRNIGAYVARHLGA